jgi:hypothetical protein
VKEVYESVMKVQCDNDIVAKLIEEKSKQEGRIVQLLRDVESKEKELKELRESVEKFSKLRNGVLEREIERIGDILVERFGIEKERIEAGSVLGVVRNIRKVIESLDISLAGEEEMDDVVDVDVEHGGYEEGGCREEEVGEDSCEEDMVEFPVNLEVDNEDIDDVISDIVGRALRRRKVRAKNCDFWEEGEEIYIAGEFSGGKVYVAGKKLGDGKVYLVSAIITS